MGQEEVYEVLNVLEFNRWDGLQYVVGSRILVNVTWKKHDWKESKHQETEQQEITRWKAINKTFCDYSISQDIDF